MSDQRSDENVPLGSEGEELRLTRRAALAGAGALAASGGLLAAAKGVAAAGPPPR